MSYPLSMSAEARDVTITFRDSCNCCRRSGRVYINSRGEAVSYSIFKARNDKERAFKRSVEHLNETMLRNVERFKGDPREFQVKVVRIMNSITLLERVNINHIEAINDLMVEYLRKGSSSDEETKTC